MKYNYVALDSKGKKTKGSIDAPDKAEALGVIKAKGLTALSVTEGERAARGSGGGGLSEALSGGIGGLLKMEIMEKDIHKKKIAGKKILRVLEQLSIMAKAGVPLTTSIHVLVLQEKDKDLKKVLSIVQEDLHSGVSIATSMAKFRAFNQVTTSIISAGEIDGKLDDAFARAAKVMGIELSLSQKIKSSMAYPIFLLFVTIAATLLLNIVVLPTFAGMFDQFGQELPALTKFVMGGSNFLMKYWYLILLFVLIIVASFLYGLRKSVRFRLGLDSLLMKIPLIGEIIYKLNISRFSRVMSSLAGSGVEIIHSISTATNVVPNTYLKQHFTNIRDDVRLGVSISDSMKRHKIFDTLFSSMVGIGEESGELASVLDKIAELYEDQTETRTKLLISLVEPAMTVLMAVVVGTVVLSVVLPMFGQYNLLL